MYCHDHEHGKYKLKGHFDGAAPAAAPESSPMANPFAKLDDLLKKKDPDAGENKH
jgi:hypothetical protein